MVLKEQKCNDLSTFSITDSSITAQNLHQSFKSQQQKSLSLPLPNSKIKNKMMIHCSDQTRIWSILKWHFSSGIRLKELASISIILSSILKIPQPSRDERRSFPLLLNWYSQNWILIEPLLPMINLRDSSDQIIDGRRELYESFS